MLKLRTKTEFTVPTERGTTQAIVRLIIDSLHWDINNVIARGYYYYYDSNNVFHPLDKIETLMLLTDVQAVQLTFPSLISNVDVVENVFRRLEDLVMFKLSIESGTNYGTTSTDYEKDLPPVEEPIEPEV